MHPDMEMLRCAIVRGGTSKGIFIMKRLITLTLVASYVVLAGLAGCNTVQGAGKDIERGGEKIQKEAGEKKTY